MFVVSTRFARFVSGALVAVALALAAVILAVSNGQADTTFNVNTISDTPDANTADGVCADGGGQCSLRAAIEQANALAGTDTVAFNIPGTGTQTIRPTSALPDITETILVDGYTQPSASPNTLAAGSNAVLRIELDGSSAPLGAPGLRIRASNSVIRGLVINRFGGPGIEVAQQNNVIAGNFIGTDAAGMLDLGNGGDGVFVANLTEPLPNVGTVIGGPLPTDRNVISGNGEPNSRNGVVLDQVQNTTIENNYFGLNAAGTAAIGSANGGIGVYCGTGHIIRNNVVAGHPGNGIEIRQACGLTTDVVVEGNTVGLNAARTASLPNGWDGIWLAGQNGTLTAFVNNNTVSGNRRNGISLEGSAVVKLQANAIYANDRLGVDLGNDGVTLNDHLDSDAGPNGLQNSVILQRAVQGAASTTFQGALLAAADTSYQVEFFRSAACDPSYYGEGETPLGFVTNVTTNPSGYASFTAAYNAQLPPGIGVTALTRNAATGETSEFSRCMRVSANNDSWPNALAIPLAVTGSGTATGSAQGYLDRPGEARWYKFAVSPDSRVVVDLTNLPADYDLVLFRDIDKTYQQLRQPQNLDDLTHLNAEFAPEMFTPEMFTPEMFTPEMFTPEMFTPEMFTPEMFTPEMFTPEMFTPEMFTPEMFTPEMFTPEMFTPEMFTPEMFTPEMFTPEMFTPEMFTPDMLTPDQRYFASAQRQSALAVSAFVGTAPETVTANSWTESGNFYVRVRGRNGAYDPNAAFDLHVTVLGQECTGLSSLEFHPNVGTLPAGSFQTLILWDEARMAARTAGVDALRTKLGDLAAAANGVVVDVSDFSAINDANAQADRPANVGCVYAKNLVAYATKEIVDAYRTAYPALRYIVIAGNDDIIPFFRYPDRGMLANESGYAPPVRDDTASQASLRLGYFLSQDTYGAAVEVDRRNTSIPVPGLAVGRLVEEPAEIMAAIDAYLSTGGSPIVPHNALVTGYDFLADAATAVQAEFTAGMGAGGTVRSLVSPATASPSEGWNADALRAALLRSGRLDLVFLAGHFSSFSALAADYQTRMLASEVTDPALDFRNTIIFSNGCHSGYNTVDWHGVTGVTMEPDWARAFGSKGAVLIAGTGYQYGDTEFVEYSERLYRNFSQELRRGTGPTPDPVSVGEALVRAKQRYLADTALMRPIHEKALFQTALFGLPMLTVQMQGQSFNPTLDTSIVPSTTPYTTKPGLTLGLSYADVTLTPTPQKVVKPLDNIVSNGSTDTVYYTLPSMNSLIINPGEPVLPVAQFNVTTAGTVLRGVGFRGGSFSDATGLIPLTGAATTELRGIHTPFISREFYPVVPWEVNYFDVLANSAATGRTLLNTIPAQYRSDSPTSVTGTFRVYNSMSFRLFYSSNIQAYPNAAAGITNIPALASPPDIAKVLASTSPSEVVFQVWVTGDPSAGIQAVWVTYAASQGPFADSWHSLDLTQDPDDSTRWIAALPLNGTRPEDVRYMVQAANGVGLVTLNTNRGAYFTPGIDPAAPADPPGTVVPTAADTQITLLSPAASGVYGTEVTFTAQLSSNGAGLANRPIELGLSTQRQAAVTDGNGRASVTLTLINTPGDDTVRAAFPGAVDYRPSEAAAPFRVLPAPTSLAVTTQTPTFSANGSADLTIALTDLGDPAHPRPLPQKPVLLVIERAGGAIAYAEQTITDLYGNAVLRTVPLAQGSYTARAYFGRLVSVNGQEIDLTNPRYSASTASVALISNTPPVAEAGGPYTVDEGASLTLTGSGSDVNAGQVLTYAWDLDNNGSYETPGATVTVNSSAIGGGGTATVRLRACDPVNDCGTGTATVSIVPGWLQYRVYAGGAELSVQTGATLSASPIGAVGLVTVQSTAIVRGFIHSRANNVTVQTSARVEGAITAAGTVSVQPGATVTGPITQRATSFPPVTPLVLSLTAGTQNITVAQNGTKTLPPGTYGALNVGSGATLNLAPGRYRFTDIKLGQKARVVITLTGTAPMLIVDVTGAMQSETDVKMQLNGGDASGILFRVAGSKLVLKDRGVYVGTFLAPAADATIQTGARLTGMIYGNRVTVQSGVQFTGQPAIGPIRSLLAAGSLGR